MVSVSRNIAMTPCVTSADRSFVDWGTEIVLEVAIIVKVQVFKHITDPRFVPVYIGSALTGPDLELTIEWMNSP